MAVARDDLGRAARKRGIEGQVTIIRHFGIRCISSVIHVICNAGQLDHVSDFQLVHHNRNLLPHVLIWSQIGQQFRRRAAPCCGKRGSGTFGMK